MLLTSPLFNPNFGGVPVAPDRRCWVSARAEALSYSAVKLFSKNSNLYDHGTWSLQTDGQTDRRLTVASPRSALASCGKNLTNLLHAETGGNWHHHQLQQTDLQACISQWVSAATVAATVVTILLWYSHRDGFFFVEIGGAYFFSRYLIDVQCTCRSILIVSELLRKWSCKWYCCITCNYVL